MTTGVNAWRRVLLAVPTERFVPVRAVRTAVPGVRAETARSYLAGFARSGLLEARDGTYRRLVPRHAVEAYDSLAALAWRATYLREHKLRVFRLIGRVADATATGFASPPELLELDTWGDALATRPTDLSPEAVRFIERDALAAARHNLSEDARPSGTFFYEGTYSRAFLAAVPHLPPDPFFPSLEQGLTEGVAP